MLRPAESKHCSICGKYSRSIAFKGGYVCESCIDYIHSRT